MIYIQPFFHLLWGKVRIKNTAWYSELLEKSAIRYKGFEIDVFPVDYVPQNKMIRSKITRI